MDWYRADWDMSIHTKSKQLARRLKWDRKTAVGAVHMLWGFAARYHQDGELLDADPYDLAEWLDLPIDETGQRVTLQGFLEALVSVGYMEGSNQELHDWIDYQSKVWDLLENVEAQREKTRERVRKHRADRKAKRVRGNVTLPQPKVKQEDTTPQIEIPTTNNVTPDGNVTNLLRVTPGNTNTLPNDTLPNGTKRNETILKTTPAKKPKKGKRSKSIPDDHPLKPVFDRLRILHPERDGADPDPPAFAALCARIDEGVDPDLLLQKAQEHREYQQRTGNEGTEFVPQLQYWLGPKKRGWEQRYAKPTPVDEGNVFERLARGATPAANTSRDSDPNDTGPTSDPLEHVPVGPAIDDPPIGDPPRDEEIETFGEYDTPPRQER